MHLSIWKTVHIKCLQSAQDIKSEFQLLVYTGEVLIDAFKN